MNFISLIVSDLEVSFSFNQLLREFMSNEFISYFSRIITSFAQISSEIISKIYKGKLELLKNAILYPDVYYHAFIPTLVQYFYYPNNFTSCSDIFDSIIELINENQTENIQNLSNTYKLRWTSVISDYNESKLLTIKIYLEIVHSFNIII